MCAIYIYIYFLPNAYATCITITHPDNCFFIVGNGFIEAGELDSFLKDLCEELGAEVRQIIVIKLHNIVNLLK